MGGKEVDTRVKSQWELSTSDTEEGQPTREANRGNKEVTEVGHCSKLGPIGDKRGENILGGVPIRKKQQLNWVIPIKAGALT